MSELVAEATIRKALETSTSLGPAAHDIPVDADLYRRGLSSHGSVNLMITIEDELGIEFPDELMQKSTFASIASIAAAVAETLNQAVSSSG